MSRKQTFVSLSASYRNARGMHADALALFNDNNGLLFSRKGEDDSASAVFSHLAKAVALTHLGYVAEARDVLQCKGGSFFAKQELILR